ncbi:Acg family FMN-binding oxidoreductase [Micromonospora sp. NBC_00858]|uniref:Acg family FMN-binding oxidoreductase n=1 Tax=Micromonospora sp. NBC_00858 TaxID=2975979 RepID=UPI003863508B|nr:nitroreductase [Micromonospora sp. NBC_00858]
MTDETRQPDRALTTALAQVAAVAGRAPSVHNTQPWCWRVLPDGLELLAVRDRQLAAIDFDGRLMTLSCGAALHHARLELAAEGWAMRVDRLPDPAHPDLLARIVANGRAPASREAMRLVQCMQVRHTDRRPVSDEPVSDESVKAIVQAGHAEGARLQILSADQVMGLAAAASRAEAVAAADPQIREELRYWTGRAGPAGTGVPPEVLPEQPPQATVPARDFARPGTLPVGPGHDRAAVYALLFGDEDEPESWLRAGEALSAAWLTATRLGVSVVPLSGVIETVGTRQTLRQMLAGLGYPYLVLRLGIAGPAHAGPPHTPRMPAEQVVDTSAVRGAQPSRGA